MDIHSTIAYDLSIKVVIYWNAILAYNSLPKRSKLTHNLSSHITIKSRKHRYKLLCIIKITAA